MHRSGFRISFSLFAMFLATRAYAADDISGVWQGSYLCGQGVTQLRLTIVPDRGRKGYHRAYFYFTPRPDAQDRSAGCFLMQQQAGLTDGTLVFHQNRWIKHPLFYVMVDMSGFVDATAGRYTGTVTGPACGDFDLQRVLPVADEAEACEPMSQ